MPDEFTEVYPAASHSALDSEDTTILTKNIIIPAATDNKITVISGIFSPTAFAKDTSGLGRMRYINSGISPINPHCITVENNHPEILSDRFTNPKINRATTNAVRLAV